MSVIEPPLVGGHTIFCDDIRHEIGSKMTLVGVYTSVMYIHDDFPFTLPKFGILVRYMERGDQTNLLAIKVFMPGDADDTPTLVSEVPMDDLRSQMEIIPEQQNSSDVVKVRSLIAPIIFAPLILKSPGVIKVRAFSGEDVVKIGALRVERAPPDDPDPRTP
jgi:hypothetical protein